MVVLAASLVRPATTAPILGADGQPRPGSIAEFASVQIGGVDQVLLLRGVREDNPVLLHLAGGPGGTDIGAMRADVGLEEHFVVVTWDQRGAGRSYATSSEPVEELTMFWQDGLAWVEQTGHEGLADRIRAAGPPPYDDLLLYQHTVSYEHQWNAYPGVGDRYEMPANVMVPEISLMERVTAVRGLFDVNWFVYPQLQSYDFRREVPTLEVPVTLVLGRYEARGRAVPATQWFEQPDDFVAVMREVIANSWPRSTARTIKRKPRSVEVDLLPWPSCARPEADRRALRIFATLGPIFGCRLEGPGDPKGAGRRSVS